MVLAISSDHPVNYKVKRKIPMKKYPLVSILIPLYNSEKYIAETIETCLNESYENIEIIIVDDGSTDNGLEVAKKYETRYGNIKVFTQKNSGAPAARNFAFEKSRGDYIQYLDADDLMSENKIASQMELVEKHGDTHIYSSRFIHFYNSIDDGAYIPKIVDKSYDSGLAWLIASWSGGGFGTVMNWLTPRHLIEKAGLWNENLAKNQDGEFFCRVLLNVRRVIYAEDTIVYYRITGTHSVASQITEKAIESVLYTYGLYEQHTQTIQNPKLTKALAYNYLLFMSEYYPGFPSFMKEAELSIFRLGFNYYTLEIPGKLSVLSKVIGSKNIIRLRHMVRKMSGKEK